MHAAKIAVVIPEDHRLQIQLPPDLPAGPAEIIVLAPPQAAVENAPPRRKRSPIGWLADEPELADAILRSGTVERAADKMRSFDDDEDAP
jgi:hypothetical protein